MNAISSMGSRSGVEVDRNIRMSWALRQVRKGFMDLHEAAIAARVPVTTLASAMRAEANG